MAMSSQAVLNSWKEIAEYVGRGVRTLQRWEQFYGFPVHRPAGNHKSAVFAVPAEVDEWLRTRPMHMQNETNGSVSASISRRGRRAAATNSTQQPPAPKREWS